MTICAIRITRPFVVLMLAVALQGCASGPHRGWAGNATLAPGWERVGAAARDAALHPATWMPMAAAGVLQVDDADAQLSDWARRETPLFGSTDSAARASDDGVSLVRNAFHIVAIATPAGDSAGEWLTSKTKGILLSRLAIEANGELYGNIKNLEFRERPDASNDASFPSGHAAKSSAYATFGVLTTDTLPVSPQAEQLLDTMFLVTATGTGWARVEAGKHYPSDVLFGFGLGNFVSRFFNAAFINPGTPLRIIATPDVVYLQIHAGF